MQALILVGGHGTRLRPITLTLAKPIIPLVDRPFLRYMIDWLSRHGVDDIVMACGFRPDDVREVLGDGVPGGPRLRYVEEPEPRGTAGAIKFAEDLLEDRFFALNGDVLTDLDLTALLEQHESSGARATLALYPVEDPTNYGLVRRKPDGEITEFLEKPDPAEIDTDEVSAGAYVLEKDILEMVPAGMDVSIERSVFPAAGRQGALLAPARGLLDGHRHARALPRRLLGHPRGQGEVGAGRDGRRAWPLRRRRAPSSTPRPRSPPTASSTTTRTSAPTPRSGRRR